MFLDYVHMYITLQLIGNFTSIKDVLELRSILYWLHVCTCITWTALLTCEPLACLALVDIHMPVRIIKACHYNILVCVPLASFALVGVA